MENEIITRIKQRIKQFLKEKKMSIYELSIRSEIADPTIRNWFDKKNHIPNLDSLIKVCNVLEISLSELVLGENETLYPVNEETRELLQDWTILSSSQKEIVKTLIKSYKEK